MLELVKAGLVKVTKFVSKVFQSSKFKNAEASIKKFGAILNDLLGYALPAIQLVAALTPTRADDEIVALVAKLRLQVFVDPEQPLTDITKKGLLLAAAREALRGNLVEAIKRSGGAGILLGGDLVKDATTIPDSTLDTAVQSAYGFWKQILDDANAKA